LELMSTTTKILIHDNGIGISPADLPFIFDRFYRADPSRGIVEGNGLGLAIAKWIAETHQAELTVTSDARNGTCFTLVFSNMPTLEAPGTSKAVVIEHGRQNLAITWD
jgi:signal transduction histidine kinase